MFTSPVARLAPVALIALLTACGHAAPAMAPALQPTDQPGTLAQGVFRKSGDHPTPSQIAAEVSLKARAYLLAQQDGATGGWSVPQKPGQPHLPAITALVLNGLLMDPEVDKADEAIAKGVQYILSHQKPDGGIYDTILPSYNTAISISALVRVDSAQARDAVARATAFLKQSQWGAANPVGVGGAGGKESPATVTKDHAFYGGWGYGNRGRPDISNTGFALQALRDADVAPSDEAFQRAIVFLQRCQMLESATGPGGAIMSVNDQLYAKGSSQGGFIYATAENEQTVGLGQSFAGNIDETLSDGTTASKLRSYGSVTYIGFKSYIYAGLTAEDPRVQAAVRWLGDNYSLAENPGIGSDGYYYFMLMMARALHARGEDYLPVTGLAPLRSSIIVRAQPGTTGEPIAWDKLLDGRAKVAAVLSVPGVSPMEADDVRQIVLASDDDTAKAWSALRTMRVNGWPVAVTAQPVLISDPGAWRTDMVLRLASLQQADGSFAVMDDRWMENNPQLVTAYALLALQHAR
jgi:squalene-hopene/tetraprenyl-beta-curcumene cyclase